jgi:membrane-associated phospholipid phosphatase
MHALRRLTILGVLSAALLCPHPARAAQGNVVTDWNSIATSAVLINPGRILDSRALAAVHAAIHDALNAIDRRYQPYLVNVSSAGASVDAAVATAAHDVLVKLSTAPNVQPAYDAAMAAIADSAAKTAGIALGKLCAEAVLARLAIDGTATAAEPLYVSTKAPGDYDFTPFNAPTPPGVVGLFPGWGRVQPWGIDVRDHHVPGPDPLTSFQYALDFHYLKAIGSVDSPWRTPEQTEIAHFWAEGAPAGWNRIANTVIREKGLDAWKAARVLALVNFASADSFIASFDAKYHFRFWRPSAAIQRADEDGNPLTGQDADWKPLFSAPPYLVPPIPDYPSNHAVVGAAAAEVLAHFFGDHLPFSTTSTSLPGVTRSFRSFTDAAVENGLSRAYAGIHFIRAIADGYWQGRGIGRTIERLLPPAD